MALATEKFIINLPLTAAKRLHRIAEIAHRPIDQDVADTLEASLPPISEEISSEFDAELTQMGSWTSEALWKQVFARFDPEKTEVWDELLYKNSTDQMNDTERQQLTEFRHESDLLMLRKAYAAVILKWRGEHVPTLEELAAAAQ